MTIFVVTFFVMLMVIVAMSVGVLLGRKPITGSCGGVGNALGESDYVCELCGGDEVKCETLKNADSSEQATTGQAPNLAYELNQTTQQPRLK